MSSQASNHRAWNRRQHDHLKPLHILSSNDPQIINTSSSLPQNSLPLQPTKFLQKHQSHQIPHHQFNPQHKFPLSHLSNGHTHSERDQQAIQPDISPSNISKEISNHTSKDYKHLSQSTPHLKQNIPVQTSQPSTSDNHYSNNNNNNNTVQVGAARKRQFRFSVHDDIKLLELVNKLNPYGAPYGCRIHKWQDIADELRKSDINIDFRRARDRTNLLLEQWREQDLSLLRRSGSGNHEDQQKKEQLLDKTTKLEQASRPRDTSDVWHFRDQGVKRERERTTSIIQPLASGSDNSLKQNTFSSVEPKPVMSVIDTRSSSQTQLPPLGQHRDVPFLPKIQPKGNNSHVNPTTSKYMKTDEGYRLSPRYPQELFKSFPIPPNQQTPSTQPLERRASPGIERSSYGTDTPIYRSTPSYRNNTPPILGAAPLDPIVGPSISSSPAIGEGQNIQLNPDSVFHPTSAGSKMFTELLKRFDQLEQTVTSLQTAVEKLSEERRVPWEYKKEEERHNAELTKLIAKAYEDKNQEREESRRREEALRSEVQRLSSFLSQNNPCFNKKLERNPD